MRLSHLPALLACLWSSVALAIEPFVVKDIRVEGVQRTEPGTVFNYLPIKVGDRVDDEKAAQAIKALYATGFFRDVRLEVDNGVLIVLVHERPTISQIEISGTKEFDKETLKKALREIGLAESRIFDRQFLDRAEQELKRQYIARGRYAAQVTTTVTPQERNRVAVDFTVDEGRVAKIARINIVGNKSFAERQLLDEIQLTTPGWLTWYTKNDQYSKQKLAGDLESLRSFYTNRGYLEFNVESTQVSITPDKEDIYITVNVNEGPQYSVADVKLAGELLLPEAELRPLIRVRPGDVFSRERLTQSTKALSDRYGIEGYAFANVNAVPDIDRDKHTVAFTFFVDPGRRVYIRRINISGNSRTRDEVIRRELRQLEGAWYDSAKIQRSRVRIQRLGFFEEGSVNIETPAVPGAPDQVDLNVTVVEKPTGNVLAGAGYSSTDGLVLAASVSQNNVLGTGNALTLSVNTSESNRSLVFALTQPYFTVDGVSRSIEVYRRTVDPSETTAVAPYKTITDGAAIAFGVPVTETDTVNFGFRFEHTQIELFETSPLRYRQFVDEFGSTTNSAIISAGWSRDSRDSLFYPTRGSLQQFFAEIGLPPANIQYYKVNYLHQYLTPLIGDFVLSLRADLGYGDGINDKSLPFYKAYYGGGVSSVRGYEGNSLGPRDLNGDVVGGRRKIIGNVELLFPFPGMKNDLSVRGSMFFDAGQIYCGSQCAVLGFNQEENESFRYSAGFALSWNSPIGPLKVSYGVPINKKEGDRVENFQFQLGTVF
jgi:outer membrane protein insertion porin family